MTGKFFTVRTMLSCVICFNLVSCIKNDSEEAPKPPPPPVVNKCNGLPGPMFTAVKVIISQRCIGCHNTANANGGNNFAVDCNIINAQANIKAVAVDQNIMPPVGGPLTTAQKNSISAWIAAGGAITS